MEGKGLNTIYHENLNGEFYSGTSGLVLPLNKRDFPIAFRDKSRLEYYASFFNSIEINSSFYKLPKDTTVSKWTESVGNDFKFTFKIPKCITHSKELNFDESEINEFCHLMQEIGGRKGCFLAQFPPSIKIAKLDQIHLLLENFKKNNSSIS